MSQFHTGNPITRDKFDAVLFDLDGVLTATAKVHAAAWKKIFDEYLRKRATENNQPFQPFDIQSDYKLYVDGKSRYDGARDFLESRGIHLPEGTPDSPPEDETVCGLGNRKDKIIQRVIESDGVEAYEGSVALVRHLRSQGIKTAVVTSSHHGGPVVEAAGIADLFDLRVDGAAEDLGVEPKRAVVVEDALSGVQAGRAGRFGLVIGVARHDNADELRANGADIVVTDLGEMLL